MLSHIKFIISETLANKKIILNLRFFLAGILASIFLIPHISWQVSHDFISFKYQMNNRLDPFSLKHFFIYWPNQFISLNPFTLGAAIFIILKLHTKDIFQRTLVALTAGFFLFFWLMSLWGHVEPQWTVICAFPMIIFVYNACVASTGMRKFVYRFVFPTMFLLFIARLGLVFEFLPIHFEFHTQKSWSKSIHEETKDLPVVFLNSYQKPSVYSFYTGIPSFTINDIHFRRNQFDLWNFEEEYHGRKVAVFVSPHDPLALDIPGRDINKRFIYILDSLVSVRKIKIEFTIQEKTIFSPHQLVNVPIKIYNPYPYQVNFNDPKSPINFSVVFIGWKNKLTVPVKVDPIITSIHPGESIQTVLSFEVPDLPQANYKFGISLTCGIFPEAFNSIMQEISIKH